MSRRSTRLATLAAPQPTASGSVIDLTVANAPTVEDGEAIVQQIENEQEGQPTKKKTKPQGTKRRLAEDKVVQRSANKKPRIGMKDFLEEFLAMPFDMLYEILRHLSPLDLLHLAWSSKKIRAFIMSKTTKSIWTASLGNIGLPKCPSDLNEPKYALLAFVKSCHYCGLKSESASIYTVWAARLQICSQCMHKGKKFWLMPLKPGPKELRDLRSLLPKITLKRSSSSTIKDVYYSRAMDVRWQNNYKNAKDKVQWLQTRTNDQKVKTEHANACFIWYREYHARLEREREALIQERLAAIETHLREMGWEAELNDMLSRNVKIDERYAVAVACQKELTEQILQKLDANLKEYLENYRKEKGIRERKVLLEARLPLLHEVVKVYRSTFPPNAVALDVGDIFTHPDVLDLIANTPDITDPNHFDPIRPKLPDIARDVQVKIEEKLLASIAAAYGGQNAFDRATVLNLATTTFSCESCFDGPSTMADPIRYPRVLVHSCATKYNLRNDHKYDIDYKVLGTVTSKTSWNKYECIAFSEESRKVLTDVVALCGFDPKTRTAAEMDAADPILECFSCNDEHSGRLTMRWSTVA